MRNIKFTPLGWEDYVYWQTQDKKTLKRINKLIKDTCCGSPCEGIGKPEALKYDLQGCWSRRIDDTNRLVYKANDDDVVILQCRFHY